MNSTTLQTFLSNLQAIVALRPSYRPGGTGEDGTCDCIGLIIGALERSGVSWSGIHGSNWWARHYVSGPERIASAASLQAGDLVFKAREPGESGYALPERYRSDADQRDYYHVGVVTAVSPLEITHCTSSGSADGVAVDTRLGQWAYRGQLTLIADAQASGDSLATVVADSGRTVNLRRAPSRAAALVLRVPLGAQVRINSVSGDWAQVVYDGQTGYMMTEFLSMPAADSLARRVARLEERVSALERSLDA